MNWKAFDPSELDNSDFPDETNIQLNLKQNKKCYTVLTFNSPCSMNFMSFNAPAMFAMFVVKSVII